MPTLEEHTSALRELGIESLTFTWNNSSEAKQELQRVRMIQKALRHQKKLIDIDVRELRAAARDKESLAGSGTSTILSLFGKRGAARSVRASARRSVRASAERALGPYQRLKTAIDDALIQLDRAKLEIEKAL
jgi:hypothetical protein